MLRKLGSTYDVARATTAAISFALVNPSEAPIAPRRNRLTTKTKCSIQSNSGTTTGNPELLQTPASKAPITAASDLAPEPNTETKESPRNRNPKRPLPTSTVDTAAAIAAAKFAATPASKRPLQSSSRSKLKLRQSKAQANTSKAKSKSKLRTGKSKSSVASGGDAAMEDSSVGPSTESSSSSSAASSCSDQAMFQTPSGSTGVSEFVTMLESENFVPTPISKSNSAGSLSVLTAAYELRSLAPRMFKRFARSLSKSDDSKVSSATLPELQEWLNQLSGVGSKWGKADEQHLVKAFQAAMQLPPLHQRLGFRFQDPGKTGTWAAKNLVGYKEAKVSEKRRRISWDSYQASYEVRYQEATKSVEVDRIFERKPVTVVAEKKLRGNPKGPLARVPYLVTAASRRRLAASNSKSRIVVKRRTLDLLPAVIYRSPRGPQQYTLIYLHGLGSSALGNYGDRPHYFFDGSVQLKVVIPTAPSREVSCFDQWWNKGPHGWKLTKFLAWYDYLSNHDGAREDHIDWDSLAAIQQALHSLMEKEIQELGGRSTRLIMGGKSQGCCTSLDATLTFPKPLGGFVGLVGHLLSCTPVEENGPQNLTPLHFFHEPQDRIMRWDWVKTGEKRLRDAGFKVRSRRMADPEKCGHFIQGVEGAWVRSALRSICKVGDTAPNH
mmetsp:Transcript_71135/g.148773  ORF Transcript_71135/g.148773 Transcript_71135/m.148773 type:complete len:666 (-) Transcript_71135:133-2130(-)|eukprot:CAMPEP_0206426032 /NCGR_PEP_ID=MMETSP0324_2-20121206/4140_1 /ASSEMBLY_ACC=CAM_ASM_000836 /TAXON_ID=2866 /ORGANISM="Crypthecodinium cohnii, Strain Seligo" /LENGTH=665 /DNA_ID=CAMNT_0053890917 /DNA_START=131 /DNA_END=2128 /DNA_ORIENTATION=-